MDDNTPVKFSQGYKSNMPNQKKKKEIFTSPLMNEVCI